MNSHQISRLRKNQGFTLIEIAIVLVIIGLLLGGVLKGQELINSAKVRSLNDKVSGITTSYFAFQDRYKGTPGDYNGASVKIKAGLFNGDGNGAIGNNNEMGSVWTHLEAAGFITGTYDGGAGGSSHACVATRCPENGFGATMQINWSDLAHARPGVANELKSGRFIPSKILSELDRKIDDDSAVTGIMQLSINANGWGGNTACRDGNNYQVATTPQENCAAIFRNF